MILSKLKPTEQLLLAVSIIVLVLGSYTLLRFVPENEAIINLQNKANKTERKLLNARIPEEPAQNVSELLKQLDDQVQALALTREIAVSMDQRLATFGSQELKVRISELARNTGIRVRTNQALITTVPIAKKSTSRNKKKRTPQVQAAIATDVILPSSYSWIARMSANTMFHRPMQKLILEGNYQSLRAFIHGLEDLDWQVTVVQLKLEIMPSAPLQGYAQVLRSELVLAL